MERDSSPDQPPRSSPPAPARRWVGVFIAGLIFLQLLFPLRYYLSASTSDERFAWRMFSYQGMGKCKVSAWDVVEQQGRRTVERLDLGSTVFGYRLENNRPEVIEKFMRWRLQQPGVVQVRFEVRCTSASGEPLEPQQYWMDRSELVVREGEPGS